MKSGQNDSLKSNLTVKFAFYANYGNIIESWPRNPAPGTITLLTTLAEPTLDSKMLRMVVQQVEFIERGSMTLNKISKMLCSSFHMFTVLKRLPIVTLVL